jgi:hypothetical protein
MRTSFEPGGDLRGVDVLAAFVALWRRAESGSLTAWRAGSRCAFDVLDGELVGVSTSDPRFETSAILVRANKLDASALERLSVPEGSDRSLAALQAGIVTKREWRWGEKIRAIEVLADLLTWIDGDYTFDSESRPEAGEFRLPIPRLVLELFLRSRDRNLIDHQLGAADVPLVRSENFDREFSTFGLTADAESVVGLIDGRASAAEIARKAPAEDFAVQKLLAALTTLGLVRPEYAPEEEMSRTVAISGFPSPPPVPEETPEPEEEIAAEGEEPSGAEPFGGEMLPPPTMPVPAPSGRDFSQDPFERRWDAVPAEPVEPASSDWEIEPEAPAAGRRWEDSPEAAPEEEIPAWEGSPEMETPEPLDRTLQHPVDLPASGRGGSGRAIGWILGLLVLAAAAFFLVRSRSRQGEPVAQLPAPTSPAIAAPEATAAAPSMIASPLFEPTSPQPVATAPAATVPRPARTDAPPKPTAPRPRAAEPASGAGARAPWIERARAHQRRLAAEPATRYAIQLELACEVPTLVDAWKHDRPAGTMWLLPVDHRGRDCFRVLWGRYPSIEAAVAAKPRIPSFFVTGTNQPAVVGVR